MTDVTIQYFKQDKGYIGIITAAVWVDLDKDEKTDLVVVGEWMPLTIYFNKGDYFQKKEITQSSGWWQALHAADMDNDGDVDFVVGNMGLNSNWQASPKEPMNLYVKDFDNNGFKEPIITYWRQGVEWCYHSRSELSSQMPSIKKRFPNYLSFAKTPFNKIFTPEMLKGAVHKKIDMFASGYFENKGKAGFVFHELPIEAQFSTVQCILIDDFNNDGCKDLILGSNYYKFQPSIGRFDASYGTILLGDGKGNFKSIPPSESGFILRGEVRDIRKVGEYIVILTNNEPLKILKINKYIKTIK
jgi:hypothetical protein